MRAKETSDEADPSAECTIDDAAAADKGKMREKN